MIRCGIATSRGDIEAALRLMHDMYVAGGILVPHPSGMRITPYHYLPTTKIAVAWDAEELVGSMTLVPDGPLGVPADAVCKSRLDALRKTGAKLIEGFGVVVKKAYRRTDAAMRLYRVLFGFARARQMTDICCSALPHHRKFYQKALYFKPQGPPVSFPVGDKTISLQGQVLNLFEFEVLIEGTPLHEFFMPNKYIVDYPDVAWDDETVAYFDALRPAVRGAA